MPTPELKRRWFHLSPDRFVTGLLLVIGLLWLSDRFQWFGFNHHKGWTVLIAVAAVGVAAVAMLMWWAASLLFHWRFQFGIRSPLVFCLVSSIAAGWLAVEKDKARRQKDTVEAMRSFGLWVNHDWAFDEDNSPRPDAQPPGPKWLRNMLGDDFFSAVVLVGFGQRTVNDKWLETLAGLSQLQDVDLNFTNISDAGLDRLTSLPQLQTLHLRDTTITDAGLAKLKSVPQLQGLDLSGTKTTDAGAECLKNMPQLQWLNLDRTQFTDAGLERLHSMIQLKELDIGLTQVTDAGVTRFQQALPNCTIYH